MSFTQHFAAISQVFSDCMHICSFQQCQYCEIGNVSMGFSKSLMPKILYKSLVFDSWFDKIFGICDLENPILTFPPHSILSLLGLTSQQIGSKPRKIETMKCRYKFGFFTWCNLIIYRIGKKSMSVFLLQMIQHLFKQPCQSFFRRFHVDFLLHFDFRFHFWISTGSSNNIYPFFLQEKKIH